MECPICLEEAYDAVYLSTCGHLFCKDCTQRFLQIKMECPLCRQVPISIRPNFFTLRNAHARTFAKNVVHIQNICIIIHPDSHAGISLENNKNGLGVRVSHVKKKDAAFGCGLRQKDVIMTMNQIPTTNHEQVVRIWNRITEIARQTKTSQIVFCEVIRRRTKINMMRDLLRMYSNVSMRV